MSVYSFIRNIQVGDTEQDPTINVGQSLITTAANIIGTSYKGTAFVPEKIYSSDTISYLNNYDLAINTDYLNQINIKYNDN